MRSANGDEFYGTSILSRAGELARFPVVSQRREPALMLSIAFGLVLYVLGVFIMALAILDIQRARLLVQLPWHCTDIQIPDWKA